MTPSQHAQRIITRIGDLGGRFPVYKLFVDGTEIGTVKRKIVKGKDGNVGRRQPAYDVWAVHGTECATQAEAEAKLIERAIRFGHIKPTCSICGKKVTTAAGPTNEPICAECDAEMMFDECNS